MSGFTLYKSCIQKITIGLRDSIYKSCSENLFKLMPSIIVNDIMSAVLLHQDINRIRMDDLEQILKCGKLQELKIPDINVLDHIPKVKTLIKILNFFKLGCQKLEILHLPVLEYYDEMITPEELAMAQTEIWESLGNLLENSTNLEDLECYFSFDLKALRNCRKLRRLSLHFEPQQHWYEFLQEEEDHFETHTHLELFNVCPVHLKKEFFHYLDIGIILRHCPQLTSLGCIESSVTLSQLHGISASELKLKHCYWDDSESPENGPHRVGDAVRICPLIEELDFDGCYRRSIPCLKNLKYLVCLNINFDDSVSSVDFNDALQEIGPQLKHLCLSTSSKMDISLLLQNCPNLKSLSFHTFFTEFAKSAVNLPNLERLTLSSIDDFERRVFRLFRDSNQLTELFVHDVRNFDDEALYHFLQRNSLLCLKVVFLDPCDLTERGFRDLLLKAPQLDKVYLYKSGLSMENYKKIISEINHKALLYTDGVIENEEFFWKRTYRYEC